MASSKVNNAGNSNGENEPNIYEMSSGENSQHRYSTVYVQSEASAPAQYMNVTKPEVTNAADNRRAQPSAPAPRSSLNETTLVDSDLYR